MKVWIFNVEHGSCAYAESDARYTYLFDCGTNATSGWNPTDWLAARGVTRINHLILSHFDQDHVTDIERLAARFPIDDIHFNSSLDLDSVRWQKRCAPGGIARSVDVALQLCARARNQDIPTVQGLDIRLQRNPASRFLDQNNLSLVAFLRVPGMNITFPGDLESAGWRNLLSYPDFRALVESTDYLVASHHGRENGFTPEIFVNKKPLLIIVSDSKRQFASQEKNYFSYARGRTFGAFPYAQERHVLSTRSDGHITIEPGSYGHAVVTKNATV